MGQRANLILVENGAIDLYCDHLCATRLDIELFWGPELAVEFIRQREPVEVVDGWLDERWCEGAAIVDLDRKQLLWFGGEECSYDRIYRRTLMKLLRMQWPGWNVEWAHGHIVEIAAYLGLPPEPLLVDEIREREGQFRPVESYFDHWDHLLTVCCGGECGAARIAGYTEFLEGGQRSLELVLPTAIQKRLDWKGEPFGGMHVDLEQHSLLFWSVEARPLWQKHVSEAWDGWTVNYVQDCLDLQLEAAQLDIRIEAASEDETQWRILDELESSSSRTSTDSTLEFGQLVGAEWISPDTNETRGSVGDDRKQAIVDQHRARLRRSQR